jgi:hypothetical protein
VRLPRPFYRLPVRFDADRLLAELRAVPAGAWVPHPNEIPGNSSVRLISAGGGANDDVTGRMRPTAELAAMPYVRQVLASFGVVWSRSRLMRLAPGAAVPLHADINYHWFSRVRLHIPVQTHPDVSFHCADERVHMAPGEAWLFDNWRLHRVENASAIERVHLVADTSGSAPFWRLVGTAGRDDREPLRHRFDPAADARVMTENNPSPPVMPAAEVELLLGDLRGELAALDTGDEGHTALLRYGVLLEEFCRDWRQLCALHGGGAAGHPDFLAARDALRYQSRQLGARLVMRTNGVAAHQVLEARLLRHLLPDAAAEQGAARPPAGPAPASSGHPAPVFIVAAPRSGSTLLFETLATHGAVATLGGEAHWLVEELPELRPGSPATDSNRLTAAAVTPAVRAHILAAAAYRLVDRDGRPAGDQPLVFLEKTPKNALRIPFFRELFPDARFIFLWRDPRENISSIIEAWRAGRWVTYPDLPGWDGPWSLLLPPQWQHLRGRPLEEIAAWQWDSANRYVLDDLAALPRARWTTVRYADLVTAPHATVSRLCGFLGLAPDEALERRLAGPLPPSRYTLTPPSPDKWRHNEALLERVLQAVAATGARLRATG